MNAIASPVKQANRIVLLDGLRGLAIFGILMVNLLAPVGRMALTNYLMHSIIAAVLFHSYGFGLFGQIELWQGVLIACVIFALQIPFSAFWLKRFRFGPFEWLWRSLTYLKIQPFRV